MSGRRLLWIGVAAAAMAAGCKGAPEAAPAAAPPTEAEREAAALEAEFEQIVAAAKAGDAAVAGEALGKFLLSEAEMKRLFGPELGARAWRGYTERIAVDLRKEAGPALVERVTDGQTEVTVEQVGPAFPARTTAGDQRMLDALKIPTRMYTVRLHRPGEKLGFRLNGFVRIDGHWRALFKTYDHLDPPPDAAVAEPAPDAGP